MVKDGSFLVFKLFINKRKRMPHTNRKHVRSENQPSCTGCLTDQQVRKLTLILAKTPKTLRRRERNLTNSTGCNYLHPRVTPTSLSISCLLFILSSSYPRLSSSQLSFLKALHDNRKNSCAKRLRPRATDRSRLCSTPMNRRVPVQRSKFLHHTQCGYPPIMAKP